MMPKVHFSLYGNSLIKHEVDMRFSSLVKKMTKQRHLGERSISQPDMADVFHKVAECGFLSTTRGRLTGFRHVLVHWSS